MALPLKDASPPRRKLAPSNTLPLTSSREEKDVSKATFKFPPTPTPPPTMSAPVPVLVDTVVLLMFKLPPLKFTSPPTLKQLLKEASPRPTIRLPPVHTLPPTPTPPATMSAPVPLLEAMAPLRTFKLPPTRNSVLKETSFLTVNLPPKDTSLPTKILPLKEISIDTVFPMAPVGPTRPPYGKRVHEPIPFPILNLLVSDSMASSPSAKMGFALVH